MAPFRLLKESAGDKTSDSTAAAGADFYRFFLLILNDFIDSQTAAGVELVTSGRRGGGGSKWKRF